MKISPINFAMITLLCGCTTIYDIDSRMIVDANYEGMSACDKNNIKFNVTVPDYKNKQKIFSVTDIKYSSGSLIKAEFEIGWGVEVFWGMDFPMQTITIDLICGNAIQLQKKVTITNKINGNNPIVINMN